MDMDQGHRFKITTVGDGMVGKTCLLITYVTQSFPDEYVPTVFDNHTCKINDEDNESYTVTLWDTAGQEDYEKLRPLSYPNTNCFLLCYSINNRTSYGNIFSKWYPEIKHYMPQTPIILVGTKSDMRIPNSEKFVTAEDGRKLRNRIGAYAFVECSALQKNNLDEVFKLAIRAIKKPKVTARKCTIL